MNTHIRLGILGFLAASFLVSGCSHTSFFKPENDVEGSKKIKKQQEEVKTRETIWDLLDDSIDDHTAIAVNRYIWSASLEVLDFMPVETVDPFSGVIVFGYGKPPGGLEAYRATVLISDPAFDPRSLHLALMTRNGPVSKESTQVVEDAILTRAAQIRRSNKEF